MRRRLRNDQGFQEWPRAVRLIGLADLGPVKVGDQTLRHALVDQARQYFEGMDVVHPAEAAQLSSLATRFAV